VSKKDVIIVEDSYEEEITANRADVYLQIKGASYFTGQAALKNAREVREIYDALLAAGIDAGDIRLEGVEAESAKGILRQSHATYLMRVACRKLELLADVMVIGTSSKNATLVSTVWRYSDDPAYECEWLAKALERAAAKAELIAKKLGVAILGIREATHSIRHPEPQREAPAAGGSFGRARFKEAEMIEEELPVVVAARKKVGAAVHIKYRVSERSSSPDIEPAS
jgi:uncharacterized protein YggE